MGPSIGSTGTTSQSPSSGGGASLRPRARRLISGLDDEQNPSTTTTTTTTRAPYTRFESVTTARSSSAAREPGAVRHESFQAASPVRNGSANKAMSGTWSHLSGIAAGLFGAQSREGSPQRSRDPRHSMPAYSKSTSTTSWGPPLQHKDIGSGSTDKRAAKLRDEKRKAMLTGNDQPFRAAVGHKRRTSDDLTRYNAAQQDETEQEMLVYIHHVRAGDTLPGLSIKYSCQANALRKANRIWPNDPIQSRKLIFVPVDASAIKSKPYTGQENSPVEGDLLGDETITLHESPRLSRSPNRGASAFVDSIIPPTVPLSPASTSNNTDTEYKHESWVLLPNDTSPTEIARLSRQNLGYFPRARRKSIGFSDRSTTSRNTSFDLGRTVQSSPLIRPQDHTETDPLSSLASSINATALTSTATRRPLSSTRAPFATTRTRSSSNPATSSSHQVASALNFLRGPGGVGTMGRNVRTIGPGNERLTELFGHHIYSVEPPRHQTVFTPWTPSLILEADDGVVRTNGVPIASAAAGGGSNSGIGTGTGLQEVGGAIEGWVRKFAKRAAVALDSNASSSSSAAAAASSSALAIPAGSAAGSAHAAVAVSRGRAGSSKSRFHHKRGGGAGVAGDQIGSGVGDLIELVDAFELPSAAGHSFAALDHNRPHNDANANVKATASTARYGEDQEATAAAPAGRIPELGASKATIERASNGSAFASVSTSSQPGVRGRKSTRQSAN